MKNDLELEEIRELSIADRRTLMELVRSSSVEELAEVLYYSCDTNRKSVALVNEINLYIAGVKKLK